MAYEYVLIDTKDVEERDVEHKLKQHPNISHIDHSAVEETAMADPIFENFNVIVKVEGDSKEEIKNFIETEIRSLSSVKHVQIFSKPRIK